MSTSIANERRPRRGRSYIYVPWIFVVFALAGIIVTFLVANSQLDFAVKTAAFAVIIISFLIGSTAYLWLMPRTGLGATLAEPDIENCLRSLEEANEYFAGSLTATDIFRLISSRISDLMLSKGSVLYLLDEKRTHLKAVASAGEPRADTTMEMAKLCYSSKSLEFEEADDRFVAAIPLRRNTEVFGVLELWFDKGDNAGIDPSVYESIGERVAPLVLNSIAYERSQQSALTDATTDLPNERAFYLILENQIAEAQRKIDERPLTILTIDIKDFADINLKYGHGAGDVALNAAARIIKDNLRQMDFFARASDDEFLAILPTATKSVSYDVVARICTGFFDRKVQVSETDAVELRLNFGWASFGEDGETATQLLTAARIRKAQKKSLNENKVLWFLKDNTPENPASHP